MKKDTSGKPKILFYDIEPWYRMEIHAEGKVKIFSDHPRSKGRELSQWYNRGGYLRTKLQSESVTIHRIVAKAALGDCPEGLVVNHIDGNKLNNHPSNLEYCTISENIKHSIENGMHVCNDSHKMPTYKDGRCKDIKAYKKNWYEANKQRLKEERKMGWNYEA